MERKYKLLIVDDDNHIRTTFQDYFTKRSFIVETASDGIEGLEKLRADEFDVALVEIKIPRMNGIEVVRQADKEGINTDMIILTGHGDRSDAVAAIKAHVFDWFDKHSLNMPELLASVFARTKALAEGVPPEEIKRLVSLVPG
ncbi:response regulator [Candidatus Parabeggiatoa sp. HSG14]|uniref:response regulator n=1 Tax=Candidatus Parabeggiatoa sp. HSG14 TaxID=3055593 RepID=UPI0025A8839E|nr:response regulator [Thiotrichales bacterium HSG14]